MKKTGERGFIGTIITLVVALALLKYFFDFNIIDFFKSPKFLEVFDYVKRTVILVWNKFLLYPISWFWNVVVLDIFWETVKKGYYLMTGWVDSQE